MDMTTQESQTHRRGGTSVRFGTQSVLQQDELGMAAHAYLQAQARAEEGNESGVIECKQHLKTMHARYWGIFQAILSSALTRRRSGGVYFTDEERLYMDLGVVDPRMLGQDRQRITRELLDELDSKGIPGCYYLSEWFNYRQQQQQLENSLTEPQGQSVGLGSQLGEARRRILDRMSDLLTGLPGIPLEVSASMREGNLDAAVITAGLSLLDNPARKQFLRRRNLWQLREQVLAKARARAGEGELRYFDLLNEIYVRDWRQRYEEHVASADHAAPKQGNAARNNASDTSGDPNIDATMDEARQMRMRILLESAVDGELHSEIILYNQSPRVTKPGLAEFMGLARTFDRALAELPPIIIVPGLGRGIFAWETGCVLISVRPLVGVDDSAATAFALLRMVDDHLNQNGRLRQAFELKFPGASFVTDFPVDYRAWLCRLTKGDVGAMNAERRAFFREFVGPDISGPILPPNMQNIGPQTMAVICRRLEKQLSSGDDDVNLHRRLAALYWSQGNMEAAGLQFNAALRSASDDGAVLFSAGMFMRSRDDAEAANECFRFGAEHAGDSLWGIYCQDALANLI